MAKIICIAYQKPMAKTSTPETGDEAVVRANVFLSVSDYVTDLFNIPVIQAADNTLGVVQVKGNTHERLIGNDAAKTKKVTVPDYERDTGGGIEHAFKVARLADLTKPLNEAKTRFRSVSIRFPAFFTLLMLRQALGTMIKKNEPSRWKLDNTGKSYLLLPAEPDVPSSRKSGAWVVTTPIATQNTDVTGVGDATNVSLPKGKK